MKIAFRKFYLMMGALILASNVLADSPIETYKQYIQTVQSSETLSPILPYFIQKKIEQIKSGLAAAKAQGKDPKMIETVTLTMLKQGTSQTTTYREILQGKEATVFVRRPNVEIEVDMVEVDGRWRIRNERFTNIPQF